MKELCRHIVLFLFLFILSSSVGAQVTFNYDTIRICAGDSYDLLKYQTNEVVVPVGWEIVGWKNITNTTVTPTTSPTVYTLQYREKANPSVIFTHDLTVSLRPKPTVSITPSGTQSVCVGQTIHVEKVSAKNYDDLYWQRAETGLRYYTDAIDDIASLINGSTITYKLIATNKDCPVLAYQDAEFDVVSTDYDYAPDVMLSTKINAWDSNNMDGHAYSYCGKRDINDFVKPLYLDLKNGVKVPLGGENDVFKFTRCEIKWDNPDKYTNGDSILGISYYNTFTIEMDLYFKGCGITKTYTQKRYLQLNYGCTGNFHFYYDCNEANGEGTFECQFDNLQKIIAVKFENKTMPGKYIPTLKSSYSSYYYNVFWDENAPAHMVYDVTVTYLATDGKTTLTYTYPNWQVPVCSKQMMINYAIGYTNLWLNSYMSGKYCYSTNDYQIPGCYNIGVGHTPTTVYKTICKGDVAYLIFSTVIHSPYEFVWDNEEQPIPVSSYNTPYTKDEYKYAYVNGKHIYVVDTVTGYESVFLMVKPDTTTLYTGTLFGVPFSCEVTVNDNRLSAADTIICSGQSVDLKSLENRNNIDGTVAWSVGANTVVTPLVDTKYLVYGVLKQKCSAWEESNTVTETVTVKVDKPLWVTKKDITVCPGDVVTLKDGLNTNARSINWYDESNNLIPSGRIVATQKATYRAEVSNTCGSATATITVDVNAGCSSILKANADTIRTGSCDSLLTLSVPVLKNDKLPSALPSVWILTPPKLTGSKAEIRNDTLIYTSPKLTASVIDSVQYKVFAQDQIDTAWVYFFIEKYTIPKITNIIIDKKEISVLATNGTPPYYYSLDKTASSTSNLFTNVAKGTHSIEVTDVHSCTSIFQIGAYDPNLVVVNDTICEGNTYSLYGFNEADAGTYTQLYPSASGGVASITLNLVVNKNYKDTIHDTICQQSIYNKHGFNITPTYAGLISQTLNYSTTTGCDSTVTLMLTVNPLKDNAITRSICNGKTYNFNGHLLTTSGVYKDTLTTTGCDSIVTLNLMVKDTIHLTITAGLCAKGSYLFAGQTLTVPGTYSHTYQSVNGCDSVVTLILKKEMTESTYIEAKINQGETYWFAGQKLIKSGTYKQSIKTVSGCDSIIILNLTINGEASSDVAVPEGFSPNGDGVNDYFVITNIEQYPNNHILIFNRWGNKVYEGKPYMNQWDGRNYFGAKVGGDLLPVGTYFYILDLGNGSKIKKGFVYLNR